MPKLGATGSDGQGLSDLIIEKVGTACGEVAAIRERYSSRIAAASSDDERVELREAATEAAVQAISDQGLTVDQYNEVVTQAQADPELEAVLLAVANTQT